MSTSPRRDIARFLEHAATRAQRLTMVRGASVGVAAAAVSIALRWGWGWASGAAGDTAGAIGGNDSRALRLGLLFAGAAIGAVAGAWRARAVRAHVARDIEYSTPALRNLLVTADELERASPGTSHPGISALVFEQAWARTSGLRVPELYPATRAMLTLLALLVMGTAAAGLPEIARSVTRARAERSARLPVARDAIARVEIAVRAPSYAGGATVTTVDPVRVDALAGSSAAVTIVLRDPSGADVRLADGDRPVRTARRDDRVTATVPLTGDGFLVAETRSASGAVTARRLIGLSVRDDAAPIVRVTRPARDLVLRDAAQHISLGVEASDDIGLAGLRLRYTKVSGSGERFTFADGEVPLRVQRTGPKAWTATADWALAGLALAPGDMVVYRAVATDRQPGAPPAESDAYIAQMLAADGDAAPGFAVDPDEERQALSQQMLILKTERLLARRASMSAEAFADAARELGVEQRRVRAEFVFMMGGEMTEAVAAENSMDELDESHEAEAESDLSAGRMANQGRTALLAAIRSMSRAATALGVADIGTALPQERNAVKQIEQAFSRSRYLLRALSQREALDLNRRGSGTLTDVAVGRRAVTPAVADERVRLLRDALGAIADAREGMPETFTAGIAAAAQKLLQADATSPSLQRAADQLSRASRAALIDGRVDPRAMTVTDSASATVAGALRAAAGRSAAVTSPPVVRQVEALQRVRARPAGRP